jgi:hypothetical protein
VVQLELFSTHDQVNFRKTGTVANKLDTSDRRFHGWYRFVLSFPPHLVRQYIERFGLQPGQVLLDPFCGTGTTIVESKINGIDGIGIEANPMAYFASSVKINWQVNPDHLLDHASRVAQRAEQAIKAAALDTLKKLTPEAQALLLKDSISPLPLHKSLILLDEIRRYQDKNLTQHELLAFAKSLVYSTSNLHFGPEVGVQRIKNQDAPVVSSWLAAVRQMADDLRGGTMPFAAAQIYQADSRQLATVLRLHSIDAVFTSPPYPNEKDYTRTTRLESVLLGFINNKVDLRRLKQSLLRSNTRNVYRGDNDDAWIADNQEIQAIAETIEQRRIELGKTSGFEKLYSKVTKLYFGGMARHLSELRPFLRPGAYLGYVVGDQASYLQVLIRTGEILADIAQSLGYQVVSVDLFRTRFATATKQQMREEVVMLRWPG